MPDRKIPLQSGPMQFKPSPDSTLFLRRPGASRRTALALATAAVGLVLAGCASKPEPAPKKPGTSRPSGTSRAQPPATGRSEPVSKAERTFVLPSQGKVIQRFDGRNNKGIDYAGNEGDPVVAARDGKVVYAAAGPRGYGQLVMIKHDALFVTAYAHNSQLLVKEGQSVKLGQTIARMGRTETDRVKLHFELRKNGNAVNPEPYFMGD